MLDNVKDTVWRILKKIKRGICWSGGWFPMLCLIMLIICTAIRSDGWQGMNCWEFAVVMIIGGLGMGIIFLFNCFYHYYYGSEKVDLLTFIEGIKLRKKYDFNDLRHIFPPAHKEMMAEGNDGNIIFGRWRGQIIGKPLNQQSGHVCVCASSGGGKSSRCIIPTILDMVSRRVKKAAFLAIDIKGELEAVTRKICLRKGYRCNYKVFNPEKWDGYGFDPYFLIKKNMSNDEKLEVLEEIVNILIPIVAEEKAASYWLEGGRMYLVGALWFYHQYWHFSFIESICKIARDDPYDFAERVRGYRDNYIDAYYSDIYGYVTKREKTLNLFYSEVKRNIILFATNQNIIQAFSRPEEECISPDDLLSGTNIFLQFSEAKMPIYNKACALVINMFSRFYVGLDESCDKIANTAWLLDEFAQLPYMTSMERCISTIRSKGVTLVFCLQEPEAQLRSKYGADGAKIFMQNCTYNIIYGTTGETAENFSKEIGEYEKVCKTYGGNGRNSVTYSTRKERIIPGAEMRDLKEKKKAVLLSPYGYAYIDTAPWYEDKRYRDI